MMMIVEKKTVQPATAGNGEYVGRHSQKEAAIVLHADISEVDYLRNRTRHCENENRKLVEENAALKKELAEAKLVIAHQAECNDGSRAKREEEFKRRIAEYEHRICKLERALIEASIR